MVVNTFPDISALIETTGPPAVDHDRYISTNCVFVCAICSIARRLFLCLHRGWRLSQRFKGCESVCVCHYGHLRMCTSSLTFQAFFCLPPAVLDTKGDSIGQTDPVPLMQRSLNPDSVQHHGQKVLLPLSDADVNYTLGKPRNPFCKSYKQAFM